MKPIKPFLISTKLFEDKNKYHISLVMHASLQVYYTDRYKTPDLQLVTTDWHRARNGVFTLIININIKQESQCCRKKTTRCRSYSRRFSLPCCCISFSSSYEYHVDFSTLSPQVCSISGTYMLFDMHKKWPQAQCCFRFRTESQCPECYET